MLTKVTPLIHAELEQILRHDLREVWYDTPYDKAPPDDNNEFDGPCELCSRTEERLKEEFKDGITC